MKIAALVPMKGHSERVPNKNMRLFNGIPLCHWILTTLNEIEEIDQIFIDTDSNIISEFASQISNQINIVKRPKELCGDYVSMNEILKYDLSVIEADYYIQTHSTNPLLKAETIIQAINVFKNALADNTHDSLFSVTAHQTRFYFENGKAVNHNPSELLPTQHLPPLYEENSNLYIFSKASFTKTNNRLGDNPMMFEIDRLEAMDIDDWTDFHLAEALITSNILNSQNKTKESH